MCMSLGGGVANSTGADQPVHPRRLISAFVKYHISTCFKRNFNLIASLCSWADWFMSRFVRNPKDRFCHDEAQIILYLGFVIDMIELHNNA